MIRRRTSMSYSTPSAVVPTPPIRIDSGTPSSGPKPARLECLMYALSKLKLSVESPSARHGGAGGGDGGDGGGGEGGGGGAGGYGQSGSWNDSPANWKLRPPLPVPTTAKVRSMLEIFDRVKATERRFC